MGLPAGRANRGWSGVSKRISSTTITDLELDHRPGRLPPRPMGLSLSLIKAPDIPPAFYRYLYWEVGRNWLWIDRHDLSDEALADAIHKPGVEIAVLYEKGAPAGFYEFDYSLKPRVHLAYFGLLPQAIGRAIGPWLLGCALAEAFDRDASLITVNTCTFDHPRAIALYQKLGFQPVDQRQRKVTIPDIFPMPTHLNSETRG